MHRCVQSYLLYLALTTGAMTNRLQLLQGRPAVGAKHDNKIFLKITGAGSAANEQSDGPPSTPDTHVHTHTHTHTHTSRRPERWAVFFQQAGTAQRQMPS